MYTTPKSASNQVPQPGCYRGRRRAGRTGQLVALEPDILAGHVRVAGHVRHAPHRTTISHIIDQALSSAAWARHHQLDEEAVARLAVGAAMRR